MHKKIVDLKNDLYQKKLDIRELIEHLQKQEFPFRAHPLGFISCSFLKEGSINARVHIWPADPEHVQNRDILIHNHIFDFESWIIAGSIKNTKLSQSIFGEKYSLYTAEYSGEHSILHKTENQITLIESSVETYRTGDYYSMKSEDFHTSELTEKSTAATILITKNITTTGTSPLIAGPIDGKPTYHYKRSELSNNDITELLKKIN